MRVVRRYRRGPDEYAVPKPGRLVDESVVLQLHVVADDHARADICTPAHDACSAQARVLAYLGQVPECRAGPERGALVHVGRLTYNRVVHRECSVSDQGWVSPVRVPAPLVTSTVNRGVPPPGLSPGCSMLLTADDLDLCCGAEDISGASRQLRDGLAEECSIYVARERLVSLRLCGYRRLAVRRGLGQFGESLSVQYLHRGDWDRRPRLGGRHAVGELGARVFHLRVLPEAPLLQGGAKQRRHGSKAAASGAELPGDDAVLHVGRQAERTAALGDLGGRGEVAFRLADAARGLDGLDAARRCPRRGGRAAGGGRSGLMSCAAGGHGDQGSRHGNKCGEGQRDPEPGTIAATEGESACRLPQGVL